MIIRGSVRRKSKDVFQKVIKLRKQGFSYSEIRKETGVAKSTINNWLTFAGLTLSREHLLIQNIKRIENYKLGLKAAIITKARKREKEVQDFIQVVKKYFSDPFFIGGILLYEAEGSKEGNGFSNSDFRLLKYYIKFLEQYFQIKRNENLTFRLYIHETRRGDLQRIINFWSNKLRIKPELINVSWKHNIVTKRRLNLDYVGQLEIRVKGQYLFARKLLSVSDIILKKYLHT